MLKLPCPSCSRALHSRHSHNCCLHACMHAASGCGGAVPRSRALPERLGVQGAVCTRAGYPHARQLPMPVMLKPEALHTAASLRQAGPGAWQTHNAGSSCCLQRSIWHSSHAAPLRYDRRGLKASCHQRKHRGSERERPRQMSAVSACLQSLRQW